MTETIPAALAAAVRRDPTTPLLTWYDDASGDRTELSGATLVNWVSKTANLLVDGTGLGTGDTAAALLPPHWQTAAILLGAWSAGLTVQPGPLGPDAPGLVLMAPPDVLFAAPETFQRASEWPAGDRFATGLLPLAMPLRELPAGYTDYTVEVRGFGDFFNPVQPVNPADRAWGEHSHAEISATVTARAAELGLTAGARVLVDVAAHSDAIDWLLAPLYAGASTVLCANLDRAALDKRITSENVTLTLA